MSELSREKITPTPEWAEKEEDELWRKWSKAGRISLYDFIFKYASERYKKEIMSNWSKKTIENGKKIFYGVA